MKNKRDYSIIGLTLLFAAGILLADLHIPLGTSEWVLYLIPLLFTSRTRFRFYPLVFAGLCTEFVILGYVFSPGSGVELSLAYTGRALGVFVIWITATVLVQAKLSQAAVEASEKRFLSFMNNTSTVAWMKDENFEYVYVNAAFERVFQMDAKQVKGKNDFDLWPRVNAEELRKHDAEVLSEWKRIESQEAVTSPDGVTRHWLVYEFPFTDSAGRKFIGGMASDLTAHKRAEAALRDSELRLRSVWENSVDGMRLTDQNGITVAVNQAFCRLVEMPASELEGRPLSIIYTDNQDEALQHYCERFASRNIETHLERRVTLRSGKTVDVEVSNSFVELQNQPPLLLGIFRDITERKQNEEERLRLERKLLDGQKLESLGILAGGIAHDFNNLLTGVLGNAGLALRQLSEFSPARHYLMNVEKISLQAADLCKQMLAYSGRGHFIVQKLNLNRLIDEMAQLLQISIHKKIGVKFDLCEELPVVEADASQIRQVLMNLIINASEAIGEKGGVITLSTGVVQADKAYLTESYLPGNLEEGEYVFFEVSDTGCGMTQEMKEKIFDPFFTTKFTGRGLGLAAVLGIVRGHSGALKVHSQPGRGTAFRVLLRSTHGIAELSSINGALDGNWRGRGTILVVDDEDHVREVTSCILEAFGFTVLTAVDGRDGVEKFQRHAHEISAVVLDMTMPRLNGEEAFREMKRISPNARVLLTSGYNEQEATNRFSGAGLAGFIQKPFKADELRQKLRTIIEGDHTMAA